jgi:hypothetical protein
MKKKEKMYSSYTSKDVIDFCIKNEFNSNTVKFNKTFLETHTGVQDLELLIEITGKDIKVINYKCSQGNEWKLNSFLQLISNVINEFNLDLNCRFIAGINDGILLSDKYTKFSTFGRHYLSNHIGMPDPLVSGQLTFAKKLEDYLKEDIPFNDKKDKMIFRGSDTSKCRDNCLNQRLMFCLDHQNSEYIDSKITLYAHYTDEMLKKHGINKLKITAPRTSPKQQLSHKYIIYINGNTVSGDRMIWQLASNSLLVQVKPREAENDYIWFHSFLNHLGILPTFTEESFLEDFNKFKKETNIEELIEKQKYFARIIANESFQKQYTKEALLKYNEIYNS